MVDVLMEVEDVLMEIVFEDDARGLCGSDGLNGSDNLLLYSERNWNGEYLSKMGN